jgi:hypothetical protein
MGTEIFPSLLFLLDLGRAVAGLLANREYGGVTNVE